jgi:type VI secretion system secreted protein VgrG
MGAADGNGASPAGSPLGGGTPMSTGEINGYVSDMGAFKADSPTGVTHSWQGSGMKFDDNKGTQKIYMQAQKDFNIVVNDCWRTIVGNDRGCIVGTDDQLTILNVHDTSIAKDQEVTVKGNQTLSVFERRAEQVDGNLNLEVGSGGFHVESTKERINYEAKKLLMIESKQKITFKVKGSTITMEPGVITIRSADKTIFQSKEGGGN